MRDLAPRPSVFCLPARSWRAAVVGAFACLAGGAAVTSCVTETFERVPDAPPVSGIVVVPFPKAKPGEARSSYALRDYYTNVIGQMQEALADGSVDVLHALLSQHDRSAAPLWAREQMDTFRLAGQSLEFADFLRERAKIEFVDQTAPALGAPLRLRITLPPWPDHVVRLGAQDDSGPAPMRVRFSVVDRDGMGARTEHHDSKMLQVSDPIVLRSGWPFTMEFAFEFPAGGAVRRDVKVVLDLLPGYLQIY